MDNPIVVQIPFVVGKKFAFDMSFGEEGRGFEILQPYMLIEEDNEVKIVLEFTGFTIHHTIEQYERMLELGTGYFDVEECKKKYPSAKFVHAYRRG